MLTWKQRVEQAREKFGKKFVHEPGSNWKPNAEPYLTRWLRGKQTERSLDGDERSA